MGREILRDITLIAGIRQEHKIILCILPFLFIADDSSFRRVQTNTHIYYGTWEVLSAAALPLQEAFRRNGSQCTLHWDEKLFHCYPVMDFIPEAKAAYEEIIGLLKR